MESLGGKELLKFVKVILWCCLHRMFPKGWDAKNTARKLTICVCVCVRERKRCREGEKKTLRGKNRTESRTVGRNICANQTQVTAMKV